MPQNHTNTVRLLDDSENLRMETSVKTPHLSPQRETARHKLHGVLASGDHVNPRLVYNYLEPHGA